MSYSKGMFAFFNGDEDSRRQVLSVNGKIEGYTVAEVTPSSVKLVSEDKRETLELKIGDVLRQEDGKWEMSGSREVPEQASSSGPVSGNGNSSSNSSESPSSPDSSAAAPSADLNSNEILKRLMELRAKENQ